MRISTRVGGSYARLCSVVMQSISTPYKLYIHGAVRFPRYKTLEVLATITYLESRSDEKYSCGASPYHHGPIKDVSMLFRLSAFLLETLNNGIFIYAVHGGVSWLSQNVRCGFSRLFTDTTELGYLEGRISIQRHCRRFACRPRRIHCSPLAQYARFFYRNNPSGYANARNCVTADFVALEPRYVYTVRSAVLPCDWAYHGEAVGVWELFKCVADPWRRDSDYMSNWVMSRTSAHIIRRLSARIPFWRNKIPRETLI